MAHEDQRDAREADVAGGDRRTSKRAEGSADPRHEPVDGFLRSKGIRFLEAARLPGCQALKADLEGPLLYRVLVPDSAGCHDADRIPSGSPGQFSAALSPARSGAPKTMRLRVAT